MAERGEMGASYDTGYYHQEYSVSAEMEDYVLLRKTSLHFCEEKRYSRNCVCGS